MRYNQGSGMGQGRGAGGRGQGQGRKQGLGPSGECVCPNCGHTVPHQRGVPCYQQTCPECGTQMTRKGLQQNYNQKNTTQTTNRPPTPTCQQLIKTNVPAVVSV
ncbi:MAG: hypothetical protein ACOCZR_02350 [Halanaerobiales bacterium]